MESALAEVKSLCVLTEPQTHAGACVLTKSDNTSGSTSYTEKYCTHAGQSELNINGC